MIRLVLCLTFCTWVMAADLPQAQGGTQERFGTWQGEPFWLRLRAADERFGGMRILELLYTPAPATRLAGTHLADHPFVLLDDHLRVMAWNERSDSGSLAEYRRDLEPPAYQVVAEVHVGEAVNIKRRRQPAPEPTWDRELLPLLLTLVEPGTEAVEVGCQSIYHLSDPAPDTLTITADAVRSGDVVRYRIERDAAGAVQRILDGDGQEIMVLGTLPAPRPLQGKAVQQPDMQP